MDALRVSRRLARSQDINALYAVYLEGVRAVLRTEFSWPEELVASALPALVPFSLIWNDPRT